jgi:signal transduction histidine kinase
MNDLDELRKSAEPSEAPAVEKAARDVGAYLDARDHAGTGADVTSVVTARDTALASLTEVGRAAQAREAAAASRIHSWDVAGDHIGWILAVSGLLILLAVYRAVFRPLVDLVGVMKSFGAGDRDVRADPKRGGDLATVGATFNELADVITVQHTRMLDFLAGVSRELKDPVQVMRMSIQDLGQGKALPSPEKMRARLALLWREVERIDRLVESFLDASRIEWDRLDLQQGRQDARADLTDIVKMYETFSAVHQIALSVPDEPVWVSFDPGRMSQVLHTLMSNAIQFSPHGGVVDVRLVADGTAGKRDKEAVLTITDYGAGMSEREQGTIFEPFHVVTGARKMSPGTSVALSVARRIVEAHGGRIDVESKVGAGTTFRVRLPLAFQPTKEEITQPGVARAARPAPSHP